MKKVFQTIVDKGKGNCMQAVVASLFDLSLEEVPNFIEFDTIQQGNAHYELLKFLKKKKFDYCFINRNAHKDTEMLKKIAKFDGGINGYFYASVPSQTFENGTHAVVIDSDLNIIHDPNPNQLAMNLTPDDVEGFIVITDIVIGKTGKIFTYEDWSKVSDEERKLNTY